MPAGHVSAKIVIDSISPANVRLIAVEVEYPGLIHAEVVSNRELSVSPARGHLRSVALGETVRALVSATSWGAFFDKYATLHIGPVPILARRIQDAVSRSAPKPRPLGSWHLPYVDLMTIEDAMVQVLEEGEKTGIDISHLPQVDQATTTLCQKVSVVRCHRAALTDGFGKRLSIAEETAQYDRLIAQCAGRPLLAAFEHAATPDVRVETIDPRGWSVPRLHGNFTGWQQYGLGLIRAGRPCSAEMTNVVPFECPFPATQEFNDGYGHDNAYRSA